MPTATQNILSKINAKTSGLRLWGEKNSPNRNIAVGLDGIHLTALQGFYSWPSYQRDFSWLTKAELLTNTSSQVAWPHAGLWVWLQQTLHPHSNADAFTITTLYLDICICILLKEYFQRLTLKRGPSTENEYPVIQQNLRRKHEILYHKLTS